MKYWNGVEVFDIISVLQAASSIEFSVLHVFVKDCVVRSHNLERLRSVAILS